MKGRKASDRSTETASAPAPTHLESLVPLDLAPQLDPSKVMLIKISAEGFDARILNGMSQFLDGSSPGSSGAPYVMLVYNRDHVKNLGCDPSLLIRTLFDRGYSIFFGGIFIYREAELQKFLKGMGAGDSGPVRSMEMLFVRREMADGF